MRYLLTTKTCIKICTCKANSGCCFSYWRGQSPFLQNKEVKYSSGYKGNSPFIAKLSLSSILYPSIHSTIYLFTLYIDTEENTCPHVCPYVIRWTKTIIFSRTIGFQLLNQLACFSPQWSCRAHRPAVFNKDYRQTNISTYADQH